ncbi:sunset domain-containing protein [Gordonia sp. FQ]|uniref:sunset domain-containing protein n=1 Tax=Gordonia sp. FQ TaxID=3446634 RepID=UPI003F82F1F6
MWWWLLLLLLIPVIWGGWAYSRRSRVKEHVVHAGRPDGDDVPRIDLSSGPATPPPAPVPAPAEVDVPAAPQPRRTATGDGVGSYLDAAGDRVPIPIGGHAPLVADAQRAPDGYPIKGDADTGLYHLPEDPWFGEVIAAVWFASEAAARAGGFRRAGSDPEEAATR